MEENTLEEGIPENLTCELLETVEADGTKIWLLSCVEQAEEPTNQPQEAASPEAEPGTEEPEPGTEAAEEPETVAADDIANT